MDTGIPIPVDLDPQSLAENIMADYLVLDIGGVLVDLGGMMKLQVWTGHDPERIKELWLGCDAVRKFESGRIGYMEFADSLITEFNLPLDAGQLEIEMKHWVSEFFTGAHELLEHLGKHYKLVCLCNTNELQWPVIRDKLSSNFTHQFISHEIGMVKPDSEIYKHVTEQLGVASESLHYFDDSMPNVEAARAQGWKAFQVKGLEDLRSNLKTLGFLHEHRSGDQA